MSSTKVKIVGFLSRGTLELVFSFSLSWSSSPRCVEGNNVEYLFSFVYANEMSEIIRKNENYSFLGQAFSTVVQMTCGTLISVSECLLNS